MSDDKTILSLKANLVITAKLGLLQAYRALKSRSNRTPHLELLEELKSESATQKLTKHVADGNDQFPSGGGTNLVASDSSVGERHNLELEQTRRLFSLLAEKIHSLQAHDTTENCWLGANAPIHLWLLDELNAGMWTKVYKPLALDLTKGQPSKLFDRFRGVAVPAEATAPVTRLSQ